MVLPPTFTRNLFFTGKGGVGKTSLACAFAIRLSDAGKQVLLVSTDPASNLEEVLQTPLSNEPRSIAGVTGLFAMNIDPEQAAAAYRERLVGPYRGILPDDAVQSMEEQFAGACTLEIAAFDEFTKLLANTATTLQFDHVVFDTAPTGHTLRLLALPSAWSGFLDSNVTGTSCLGPLAGLQDQREIYQVTVDSLCNPECTTLFLVTRPERSALREAERSSRELHRLGVTNQQLLVNGVFTAADARDPVAVAMQGRCEEALAEMPAGLADLQRTTIPLSPTQMISVEALRNIDSAHDTFPATDGRCFETTGLTSPTAPMACLNQLIDDLASTGRGVILTMGKGGVGKTTIAAAIAVGLVDLGHSVHLSTTDPAAHLMATLDKNQLENLTVSSIDPVQVTDEYRREVLQHAGSQLDQDGRRLLEEDLRSPCTEEIAVFRAFATAVSQGKDGFVVLDTAPTGHTILLLDAALAYHREISRQTSQLPESVIELLPRLRDPSFTRVLVITLPESTPVHEAVRLQQDLRRADIEPFSWVINQSLRPLKVCDPVLLQRQQNEQAYVAEVDAQHAKRTVVIPWVTTPPVGLDALRQLSQRS
ncbi:MAG: arsenical pump-driving ATPase [Pirellulaceae bacterium]